MGWWRVSSSGAFALRRRITTLDGAAIQTLHSAPTEILPAPGAGLGYRVVDATVEFVHGHEFSVTTVRPLLFYGSVDANKFATSNLAGVMIAAGADPQSLVGSYGGDAIAPQSQDVVVNAALITGTTANDIAHSGPILTAGIDGGGTGYAVGDTGIIEVPTAFGVNATYRVDSVDGGTGEVLSFTVMSAGAGFFAGQTYSSDTGGAQPGVGVDFDPQVLTVGNMDGDLYFTVIYYVQTLHG